MAKAKSAFVEALPDFVFDRAVGFLTSIGARIISSQRPVFVEASQGSWLDTTGDPMKGIKRVRILIQREGSGSRVEFQQDFSGQWAVGLLLMFVVTVFLLMVIPFFGIWFLIGSILTLLIMVPYYYHNREQLTERFWSYVRRALTSSDTPIFGKCPKCWHPLSSSDRFCQNCGRPVAT